MPPHISTKPSTCWSCSIIRKKKKSGVTHYDGSALSGNPGLQYVVMPAPHCTKHCRYLCTLHLSSQLLDLLIACHPTYRQSLQSVEVVRLSGRRSSKSGVTHYNGSALSGNPGLQYPPLPPHPHPHSQPQPLTPLHGPVHTPDNNRWDTPPV